MLQNTAVAVIKKPRQKQGKITPTQQGVQTINTLIQNLMNTFSSEGHRAHHEHSYQMPPPQQKHMDKVAYHFSYLDFLAKECTQCSGVGFSRMYLCLLKRIQKSPATAATATASTASYSSTTATVYLSDFFHQPSMPSTHIKQQHPVYQFTNNWHSQLYREWQHSNPQNSLHTFHNSKWSNTVQQQKEQTTQFQFIIASVSRSPQQLPPASTTPQFQTLKTPRRDHFFYSTTS